MSHFRIHLLVVLVGGTFFGSNLPADEGHADLALRSGKVVTVDVRQPTVQALAVRGDTIMAVGSDEEIKPLIGEDTRVIDLRGRLAIPGFIEGHGHFLGLGESKLMLDLTPATSWDQIVEQVGQAARDTPAGSWIVGRGWHQEKWASRPEPHVNGYPVHTRLSEITPNHPVLLTHASGHMSFANAQAMKRGGVDATTSNPPGGEILKDEHGQPTGVFREAAQGLVERAYQESIRRRSPVQHAEQFLAAVELAMQECLKNGVTSFQDAGSPLSVVDRYRALARDGKLRVRLWVMIRDDNAMLAKNLANYRTVGYGNNFLTVRAIKRSIDGALGAHGAWLLMPYDDLPSSAGLNTSSISSIRETAKLALEHDYQLCVHAIGDRANRETLDVFEELLRSAPTDIPRRWRIEHAQHLDLGDIPRFAELGVIASMQGIHCTSDAVYVLRRLGPRRAAQGAYVWRSLIDAGALIANGTDAPVENINPLECFYASVTRKLPSGVTFFPEQRMTRDEALQSYTLNAAYAAFEDDIKGSLSPGKLADVVVLSKDIMTVPEQDIRRTVVDYTIVGGKVVYARRD